MCYQFYNFMELKPSQFMRRNKYLPFFCFFKYLISYLYLAVLDGRICTPSHIALHILKYETKQFWITTRSVWGIWKHIYYNVQVSKFVSECRDGISDWRPPANPSSSYLIWSRSGIIQYFPSFFEIPVMVTYKSCSSKNHPW